MQSAKMSELLFGVFSSLARISLAPRGSRGCCWYDPLVFPRAFYAVEGEKCQVYLSYRR